MAFKRKSYKRKSTQKKVTVQTVKSMITKRTDWAYEPQQWVGDYYTTLGTNAIVRQCVSPPIAENGVTIQKSLKVRFLTNNLSNDNVMYRVIVVQDKGGLFSKFPEFTHLTDTQYDKILITSLATPIQQLSSLLDPENTNFNILLDTNILSSSTSTGRPIIREWTFNKLLPLKRNPSGPDGTGNVYVFTISSLVDANNQFVANSLMKYST